MLAAVVDQTFIHAHSRTKAHDGLAVALGLRQVHAQVDVLAAHHLDVLVLHELDVARPHEGVCTPCITTLRNSTRYCAIVVLVNPWSPR